MIPPGMGESPATAPLNITPQQAQATLAGIQNGTIGANLSPEARAIVIAQLQSIINAGVTPTTGA